MVVLKNWNLKGILFSRLLEGLGVCVRQLTVELIKLLAFLKSVVLLEQRLECLRTFGE